MKISISTFILISLFASLAFANSEKPIDKAIEKRIQSLTSTNNALVYLDKIQSELSAEEYQKFRNLLGKKNVFQARKLSKNSFSVQFSGNRAVRFTLDTQKAEFLVKNKPFRWSLNKPIEDNLNQLYSLINQEYPKSTAQNIWSYFLPKLYAWSLFDNSEDEASLIVVGSMASSEPFMGLEAFLNKVETHCNPNPHPLAHRDAHYFETKQRHRLQTDFNEAKEAVDHGNLAHMYGLWPNKNLIGRFHEAQTCLRDRRYIKDTDLLPIEYNEQKGTGKIVR